MIIHSPIISGSLTFADGATVTYPEGGVYSGSFSGSFQGEGSNLTFGGTGIVSSSAQIDELFNLDGVFSGSSQVEFNDINNNPLSQSASTVTLSKSIVPSSATIDLGTAANPFRDVYISSASLYINGTQVISTDGTDLTIQTDAGESFKVLESGNDTITLETANGDITLTSSGNGNIELDAPVQVAAHNKILSSDGNSIQFGNGLGVTGSIAVTGTVDGVDVSGFRNTFNSYTASNDTTNTNQDSRLSNLEANSGSYQQTLSITDTSNVDLILSSNTLSANLKGGVVSGSAAEVRSFLNVADGADNSPSLSLSPQIAEGTPVGYLSLSGTKNHEIALNQVNAAHEISNLTTDYVDEGSGSLYYTDTRVKTKLNSEGVISGSSQVFDDISGDITIASNGVATIAANSVALGTDTTGNYVGTLTAGTGITSTGATSGEGIAHSLSVDYGSSAGTAVQGNTTITLNGTSNEIDITGTAAQALGGGPSYTIGLADSISGDRTFSNNVTITGNLTVNGTTTTVNSNTVNIGDNVLVLNSDETGTPSQNGGLEIERGTSTNSALLWDESNDYWIAGLAGSEERIVIGAGNTSITTLGTITTGTWNGTAIADGYISSATAWNAKLDSAGTIATNDYAKYDANGDLVGRSYSEVRTDLSLNNVENTAVSTFAGSSNITTLGTISTGTWNGSVIASAYLDSDTAHLSGTQTFSGAKTFSSAVNISNSTASTTKTTGALIVTGGVGISGALNVGGDVVAYASSDERLKDNIELISNPIEKVQSLKGVTWNWNENADELQQSLPNVGVIAQDVEKVLPQLVHDRDNGFKGVDYAKLTGLLIEAIKEQQKQIDELKSKIQ